MNAIDVKRNRLIIINYLQSTNLKGIDKLLEELDSNGFYTAPCSTQHHLCCEGGLAQHSLNVCDAMFHLSRCYPFEDRVSFTDIIITSLLHDLGKVGQFGKESYIPNMVDSRKKDADGNKILKQSEAKPFISNPNLLYIDHEIRSVAIASKYIALTEGQQFAILYHNGMYSNLKYALQGKETPLQMMLHFADLWSSRVTEMEREEEEKELLPFVGV